MMKITHFTRKFRFALIAISLASTVLKGQSLEGPPARIDYQGQLLNAQGGPLTSAGGAGTTGVAQNFQIHFRIWDAQTGGTLVWAEKQIVTVNEQGLFSVQLGEGDLLTDANKAPDTQEAVLAGNAGLLAAFNEDERYIGVTVIQTGQTPGEIQPRLRFLSAPYAVVADQARYAESGPVGQAFSAASVTSTGDIAGASLTTAGTVSANSMTATGNINTFGLIASGGVIGASVNSTGNISASGTISTNNAISGGTLEANTSVTAPTLSATLQVVTPALNTGTVAASGNITGSRNFTINASSTASGYVTRLGAFKQGNGESYPLQLFDFSAQGSRAWNFAFLGSGNGSTRDGNLGLAYNNQGRAQLNSGTGSWQSWSDIRLKENIEPLDGLLERATSLEPKSYNYTTDEAKQYAVGFIAQDVRKVFPDLVHEDSKGMLSLSYNDFGVIAIGAIKELNEEVKDKDQRILELEQRLSRLERRFEKMNK